MLAIAVGFGSTGCATLPATPKLPAVSAAPPAPTLEAVPEWALANPNRDADAWLGIGSGASLDEATRYALRDVASRLSVSVESQLRDTFREDGDETHTRLEQVIETRVTGTRFAGWERTRSAERAGVFWVEVRIDRGQLARDSASELTRLADEIDMRLSSAESSSLRRLMAVQRTDPDRQRAADLIALLDVVDPGFARGPWETRRDGWRAVDEAARRALVFEIRADRESQEIADWVETRLLADRLRTREGGCESEDAVCIDIRSEVTETRVASRHIAKIRSTLALLEPSGSVLRAEDVEGRGASKSDRDRARRRALDDLRDGLSLFSVLGGVGGALSAP